MIGILFSELFCGGIQRYWNSFSESDILFILDNQDPVSGCFRPNQTKFLSLVYTFI